MFYTLRARDINLIFEILKSKSTEILESNIQGNTALRQRFVVTYLSKTEKKFYKKFFVFKRFVT